jgi:hypothetical protein
MSTFDEHVDTHDDPAVGGGHDRGIVPGTQEHTGSTPGQSHGRLDEGKFTD